MLEETINKIIKSLNGTLLIKGYPFDACKISKIGRLVFLSELCKVFPCFTYKEMKDKEITIDNLYETYRKAS